MAKPLTKDDINELTSKIRYSSFDRGQEGCQDLEFYSNISGDFEQRYRIHNLHGISDKILKALCFIHNKKKINQGSFDEEICSYLYYWLGDKIYPKVQNQTVFSNIIRMIYDELSRTSMFRTCNALHDNIDEDTFRKYKLLFDYSIDNYHIKLNTVNPNTTCDEHYKEAIDEYINTYNDVYFHCTQGDKEKYDCEYFKKLFKKYEHKDLESFHCTNHKTQLLSTKAQRYVEQTKPSSHVTRGSEMNSDLIVIPGPRGNKAQHEIPGPLRYVRLSEQNELDSTITHNTNNTSEGGTSKTIAGSVAPVLGVSSISLLLYKLTPVGGYINRLLGRNRNMHDPVEYMDSFNPYSDGMIPGDRTMNISYHRL
ncbi:Plasmodium vivax Vir protein, putative [Plasmodium vivax]|nr:Plasmodium vivax Vir protein, putative [Plasmodium vivax]